MDNLIDATRIKVTCDCIDFGMRYDQEMQGSDIDFRWLQVRDCPGVIRSIDQDPISIWFVQVVSLSHRKDGAHVYTCQVSVEKKNGEVDDEGRWLCKHGMAAVSRFLSQEFGCCVSKFIECGKQDLAGRPTVTVNGVEAVYDYEEKDV